MSVKGFLSSFSLVAEVSSLSNLMRWGIPTGPRFIRSYLSSLKTLLTCPGKIRGTVSLNSEVSDRCPIGGFSSIITAGLFLIFVTGGTSYGRVWCWSSWQSIKQVPMLFPICSIIIIQNKFSNQGLVFFYLICSSHASLFSFFFSIKTCFLFSSSCFIIL